MPTSGDTFGTDPTAQKYARFSGFTTTVLDSYINGSHPKGASQQDDGSTPLRILSIDTVDAKVRRYHGFGPPVLDSISATRGIEFGLEWDEDDNTMYATRRRSVGGSPYTDNKAFQFSGFSTTLSDSIVLAAYPNRAGGCTWVDDVGGKDFAVSDFVNGTQRRHTGFTTTVNDSFGNGGFQSSGLFWDPADETYNEAQQQGGGVRKVISYDGFSSTVLDSISIGTTLPTLRGVGYTNAIDTQNLDMGSVTDQTSKWTEDDAPIVLLLADAGVSVVFGVSADASLVRFANAAVTVVFGATGTLTLTGFNPGTPTVVCTLGGRDLPCDLDGRPDVEVEPSPRGTDVDPRSC